MSRGVSFFPPVATEVYALVPSTSRIYEPRNFTTATGLIMDANKKFAAHDLTAARQSYLQAAKVMIELHKTHNGKKETLERLINRCLGNVEFINRAMHEEGQTRVSMSRLLHSLEAGDTGVVLLDYVEVLDLQNIK